MARKQKLKVFRTPIGFHDAYVAAPSRRLALKAWGADADLFARGVAEEVTDAALIGAPLDRPGEIIKVARGSEAEHLAAASSKRGKPKKRLGASSRGETVKSQPQPSRRNLDAAEADVRKLDEAYQAAAGKLTEQAEDLKRQLADLENERRELDAMHDRDHDEAQAAVDCERKRHSAALETWLTAQG
ncbi:hypothetical protein ACFSC3_01410 [Sphingomonas floccifaciens]|uniref:Cell envelope biogenesis protein TolA n=1 Tax=Sphingomonas floccifaciens TaxID=1844115 RepID=A0ABW4N9P3_9SPHN